jgi:hypothetical protein
MCLDSLARRESADLRARPGMRGREAPLERTLLVRAASGGPRALLASQAHKAPSASTALLAWRGTWGWRVREAQQARRVTRVRRALRESWAHQARRVRTERTGRSGRWARLAPLAPQDRWAFRGLLVALGHRDLSALAAPAASTALQVPSRAAATPFERALMTNVRCTRQASLERPGVWERRELRVRQARRVPPGLQVLLGPS